MRHFLVLTFAVLSAFSGLTQITFPVNGTVEKEVVYTAFTNATLHIDPQTTVENATLLIFKGRIAAAGQEVQLPAACVVRDLKGAHIYPSFIDLYSNYGMPEVKPSEWSPRPQTESKRKGAFGWNEAIKADTRSNELFAHDAKSRTTYHSMGFGAVMTHHMDGIARGTAAMVALGENENKDLLSNEVMAAFSFSKGSSRQDYPSSLMGSIALLRQSLWDADWYARTGGSEEANISLQSLAAQMELPWLMDAGDKWNVLRADKLGDEFGKQFLFVGSGDEYQRLDELSESEGSFIIPIDFPAAFDLSDPYLSRMVSLAEMKHWEIAPENPARLAQAEISFALTSKGHQDAKSFWSALRKAIQHGLPPEKAFEALTTVPAGLAGMEHTIGSLKPGMLANFLICSGDPFKEEAKIRENYVNGVAYPIAITADPAVSGTYNLTLDQVMYELVVSSEEKPGGKISYIRKEGSERDTLNAEVKITRDNSQISMSFSLREGPHPGLIRLSGNIHSESRIWEGKAQLEDGIWVEWVAVKQAAESGKTNKEEEQEKIPEAPAKLTWPLMAYGWDSLPEAQTILIKNATIWTCEEEGIIENGQVLIHEGKIAAVGAKPDLNALFPKGKPEIRVIDARGKHLTPGIIDEHSHIAVSRGVNEGTQASSAEVSIADVINPDDINIYRQLSGGVTASQLLHGSANPIGGQSGIIKLRWGRNAEEMKIENAAPFIKFALGENVKQSNWGESQTQRFPQTRMGVEQVYYDHFIRAREYGAEWDAYDNSVKNMSRRDQRRGEYPDQPRRDFELETLLQILKAERFVTCHSYVQSEINMLMHVADSMGFTLNTFTHILEGYKVADKMKEHGAGASSFSDWWAYKFEVKDAIPYNGAILWENGVITAFNSDDAEMARRLNQEAGKAVKYGGVPEEEALKFVTLNPAKLLHLDDHMGSIKVGKDADLVIWSDHPLSIYARAEQTYIDGICYFDAERDRRMRESIRLERARLTQKMMQAKDKGEKTRQPTMKPDRRYHCDTLGEEGEIHNHELFHNH